MFHWGTLMVTINLFFLLLPVEGETSTLECAHQLGKLCENRHLVVNLIPYNATDVKDKLQCPSNDHMQKFRDIVASYGTFCTIRRTMGADIASACGQLVQKSKEQDNSSDTVTTDAIDIEEAVGTGAAMPTIPGIPTSGTGNRPHAAPKKVQSMGLDYSSAGNYWLGSLTTEDLDRWMMRLTVAVAISATCFAASSFFVVRKR